MRTEREHLEAVIWNFLREAEPEWESGKCALYAEDLAGRIAPLLRSPVGEPVGEREAMSVSLAFHEGYRHGIMDAPGGYYPQRAWMRSEARKRSTPSAPTEAQEPERKYPCAKCGKMRSKAEGGTVFTVCEECWPTLYPPVSAAEEEESDEDYIQEWFGEGER